MEKTKVLHLVEDLGIGGLERIIASIVTNLDKNKYDTGVWCLSEGGEIAFDLIRSGINVKILGMKSYHNPLNIIALLQLMRRNRIKILHIHGYYAGTFGRLAAIIARVPIIIYHVHSTYYGYKKRNILIEKTLSFFTDNIICVSRAVWKFVVQVEGINEKKACLIYNGIEAPEVFDESLHINRDAFGLSKEDFVAITVASLTPHKGHHVLINAMKTLSQKHSNLGLLIAGEGPLKNSLDEHLKELPFFSKILFAKERKEVLSLLKLADVFILPSVEREGLGIALIEAMAVGLPVIGTRLGGIPEVIQDNINGLLVTPGNHEELAAAIEKVIGDKAIRDEMGHMGKKIYEKIFTVETMIRKIERLYDSNSRKLLN